MEQVNFSLFSHNALGSSAAKNTSPWKQDHDDEEKKKESTAFAYIIFSVVLIF